MNATATQQRPCIIAIMGCTGVGKSTFIRTIGGVATDTGADEAVVGDSLQSCTSQPKLFGVPGSNTWLIDTPGFNDTNISDREMLRRISDLLATLHRDKNDISGILYMHPINDARVTGSSKKNLDLFRKVVGINNMSRCVFVTTKWSCEQSEKAVNKERELIHSPEFWKPMFDAGVGYARFEDTQQSALSIVKRLESGKSMVPKVVVEWTQHGKRLHETEAGRAVEDDVAQAKKVAEADIREVRKEAADALAAKDFETAKALEKERKELEGRLRQMEQEREKLRIDYEEQRKAQEAQRVKERKDWEERQKKEAAAHQVQRAKERKDWEDRQKQAEEEHEKRRQERESQYHREIRREKESWKRAGQRTFWGAIGTAAIVATGGLAAPVVGILAVAHEEHMEEKKRKV